MLRRNVFTLMLIVAALLSACAPGQDPQAGIQTSIAQTLQIALLETAAASDGQQPSATPGAATETPTITLIPTSSIPFVSVSQATNCRTGPSVAYGLVTTIQVGQQVEVVETFSASYVVVRNPNGAGLCWLWLQYATPTNFSAYNLPQATQPPTPVNTATPTPSFIWEGNWNMWSNGVSVGTVNVNESGNSLSGGFTWNGKEYTFSMSLNASHQRAEGTYTNHTDAYTRVLVWRIKSGNLNQFEGYFESAGTNFEWCGWRSGSSMPDPCILN
ncbi:MAG: hypothetical protein ACRDFQ_06225 [Anaerolineales bacterium]